MNLYEDAVKTEGSPKAIKKLESENIENVSRETLSETEQEAKAKTINIKDVLTKETGQGEVEDYLSHPMNFNESVWLARILRGVTGYAGNLRWAIIDILGGLYEMRESWKN